MRATWRRGAGRQRRLQLAAFLVALGLFVVLGVTAASAQEPVLKDNGKIAFVSARSGDPEIYTMNPDGTQKVRLTFNAGPSPDFPLLDFWPSWSSDGTKIVYTSFRPTPEGFPDGDIFIMDADGENETRVTTDPRGDFDPAFFPDGRQIVFIREGDIWTINTDGRDETNLTPGPERETEPAVSPDGTKIVFERGVGDPAGHESGNHEIFVMNADGTGVERLTDSPDRREQHPSFSPDGTRIVFDDNFHAPPEDRTGFIYSMKTDGTDVTQLTSREDRHGLPSYSPDGTKITFTASEDIWKMDADGSNQVRLTGHPAFDIQSNWQPIPRATPEPGPEPELVPHGTFAFISPCSGGPGSAGYLYPAKLRVSRARVLRSDRRLDVLAPITALADGDVRVTFEADDRRDTFEASVTEANTELDHISILEPITRGQAELGTGIVNLEYLGDADTRPDFVRLRAASQRAELDVDEISLVSDRLSAHGSVTSRAQGVVRFRFSYLDTNGSPQVHIARATIQDDGDWALENNEVPAQLANCGGYLAIQFTGYLPRRIRGEQLAYELHPGHTRRP